MLFRIDASIAEALRQAEVQQDLVVGLSLLAHSRRYGNHLLFAEKSTVVAIVESAHLSAADRAVFSRLLTRLPEKGALVRKLNHWVELIAAPGVSEVVTRQGSQRVLRMSIGKFTGPQSVSPTCLLCEGEVDPRFYRFIAEASAEHLGVRGIQLQYEARGGGGVHIGNEYRKLQEEDERLVLCIVDSDRRYPESELGATATGVREADNPRAPRTMFRVLECHESENLLPTKLILQYSDNSGMHQEDSRVLAALEASAKSDVLFYIDVKDGLSAKSILYTTDARLREYWESLVRPTPTVGTNIAKCRGGIKCARAQQCRCEILKGMGDGLLSGVLDMVALRGPRQPIIFAALRPQLREEWRALGALVVSWCCAGAPLRA